MAKISNFSEIDTAAARSVWTLLDPHRAAQVLAVVVGELRTALDAEADYRSLANRSARQLTRLGLSRARLAEHIHRRHYC
jgi:hypothetical protein